MYNLFAILRDHSVARIKLDNPTQKKVSAIFTGQVADLLDEERERHPYAPTFVPTDGGIVELKDGFSLPESLERLSPTMPNDVPMLSHNQVEALDAKAVVAVDLAQSQYCFQSITSNNFLGPKKPVLLFGPNANELKDVPGIVLGSKLDAVYDSGGLYFTSETVVRRFLDLDVVFRESTDDEIREVFGSNKFTGFDEKILDPSVADTWVRRKVMFIQKSNVLDVKIGILQTAAKTCKIGLTVTKNRIELPTTRKELKMLLKFLSEDFLESPLRPATIYEVSSKRPI
jgi:hypothetical protein